MLIRSSLIGIVVVATVGVSTASASPTPYFVTAGSTSSGTVAYTGKLPQGTSSHPSFVLRDTTSNTTIGCNTGTISGTVTLGSRPPQKLIPIAKSTFMNCAGPDGLLFNLTQQGTWEFNGTTPTTSSGVTIGNLVSLTLKFATATAGQCVLTVSGTSKNARYSNSPGTLALVPTTSGTPSSLMISNVSGCFGIINNGDVATITATYTLSTSKGKIKIVNS